jgi:Domain of unknown function (DUF4326)
VRVIVDQGKALSPSHAVYVGRRMAKYKLDSPFGNPHKEKNCKRCSGGHDRAEAVEMFRRYLSGNLALIELAQQELRGKDLACWCDFTGPCHADVLLEIANREAGPGPDQANRKFGLA